MRGQPDINAIATRKDHEIEILVWNYHDDDVTADPAKIDLTVSGLAHGYASQALLEHFRIDADHSNAFTAWKEMGSPQTPSPHQYEQLESAGQLQLLASPSYIPDRERCCAFAIYLAAARCFAIAHRLEIDQRVVRG